MLPPPLLRHAPVFSTSERGFVLMGHRGMGRGAMHVPGRGTVRENTIDSMLAAVDAGAEWVALDAIRTADFHLVGSHNPVDDDGTPFAAMSTDEAIKRGAQLLGDILDALPERTGVVVEVKPVLSDLGLDPAWTTAGIAVRVIAAHRVVSRRPMLTYGFDPSLPIVLQQRAIAENTRVPVGLIAEGGTNLAAMTIGAVNTGAAVVSAHAKTFIGPATQGIAPHTIADVITAGHRAGLQYMCWCPTVDEARVVLAAGVDAICVDDVQRFASALAR